MADEARNKDREDSHHGARGGRGGHGVADHQLSDLTGKIIDAGLTVHKALGPGLLESVYEHCLAYELQKRGIRADRQVWLPVHYDGVELEAGYRLDLVVEDDIVIEIKAVDGVTRLHQAQLLISQIVGETRRAVDELQRRAFQTRTQTHGAVTSVNSVFSEPPWSCLSSGHPRACSRA